MGYTSIPSSLDGSSDHTPVILTLGTRQTDWRGFRNYLDENINLSMPLKNKDDIDEAYRYITNLIQVAASINTLAGCHKYPR